MKPFFSIVIPTRNRPDFLKYSLKSIQQQKFNDFEVIVSDNSDNHDEVISIVEEMKDPRFKVVCTPSVLRMSENFNYGLSHATGSYISVIADKTLLLAGALKRVHKTLSKDPTIDVINWLSDWYSFKDEGNSWEGFYHTQQDFHKPLIYSTKKELKFRLSFLVKRSELKRRYFRGQIYYGFYSSRLIQKIKKKSGKLFHDLSPDYTSLILGFLYSAKSCDIGMPLSMMFVTNLSNGNKGQNNTEEARKYISESLDCSFEEFLEHLPFSPFYEAITNTIVYDFIHIIQMTKNNYLKKHINYNNLSLRILEEIQDRYPLSYQKIILEKDPSAKLLKGIGLRKFFNKVSFMLSEFNLKEIQDRFFMKFSGFVDTSGWYSQKQKQRNAYFAQPCSDPMEGLEYGHNHYRKFSVLDYK